MESYSFSISKFVLYQEWRDERKISIRGGLGGVEIPNVSHALFICFGRLAGDCATEEELFAILEANNESHNMAVVYYYIELLQQLGMLSLNLVSDSQTLATLIPASNLFRFTEHVIDVNQNFVLSRFLYIRNNDGFFVVESPLALAIMVIKTKECLDLFYYFSSPNAISSLPIAEADLPNRTIVDFVNMLLNIGGICPVNEHQQSQEEVDTRLRQWEFHDLLFHSRSRMGRHGNRSGGVYPFANQIAPEPPVKELPIHDLIIDLYRPNLNLLQENDMSLTQALESRRSSRKYGEEPLTAKQLGEFLYRVARTREKTSSGADGQILYDTVSKPYPSGGGSYELELYLTIAKCADIPQGIYYYDGREHRILRISDNAQHMDFLLDGAYQSAAKLGYPQILITITARFKRVSWKYRSIVYAVILKNTGVLYQTMYLVATSMDIGACGLGNGNADLSAVSFGNDYLEESSVGDFMIGSLEDSDKNAANQG